MADKKKMKQNIFFYLFILPAFAGIFLAYPTLNAYNDSHFTVKTCKIIDARPYVATGGIGKSSFSAGNGVLVNTEDCGKFTLKTWKGGPNNNTLAERLHPGESYKFKFGDIQITILGMSRVSNYIYLK